MKQKKNKLKAWYISGNVPYVFNAEVIAEIGKALNHNADVLDKLIERVEKLENDIRSDAE